MLERKMRLNEILKRVYSKLYVNSGRSLKHSYKEVKDYIGSFHEPKNDIDRSYYQYLCQKWDTMSKEEFFLANIAAFILFLPKYITYRNRKVVKENHCDVVLTLEMLRAKIPSKYVSNCVVQDFDGGSLSLEDAGYLKKIIREHPISFFYNYKIMCRLAAYAESISRYSPNIIFSSAEYSFTSSVLTNYCEKRGVKHINIMHGEKRYNARDAFSRFTEFYIWDEYYKNLFHSLRADKTEYVIQKMCVPNFKVAINRDRCTYYLQLHTKEQLERIKKALEKTGMDYLVRPHPLYSGGEEKTVFGVMHLESNDLDIWKSIASAGTVISQDSTVLYQAYLVGADIVIDDVSDTTYFSNLEESGYIMISKPHKLLSELTEEKL